MVLAGETFGNVNNALIKVTHVVLIPSSMWKHIKKSTVCSQKRALTSTWPCQFHSGSQTRASKFLG
jgi:hypothetical protein